MFKCLRPCHVFCKNLPIWYGQIPWDPMTHPWLTCWSNLSQLTFDQYENFWPRCSLLVYKYNESFYHIPDETWSDRFWGEVHVATEQGSRAPRGGGSRNSGLSNWILWASEEPSRSITGANIKITQYGHTLSQRVIRVFPGYLPSPSWSPYWICAQHPTCQWSLTSIWGWENSYWKALSLFVNITLSLAWLGVAM